LVTSSGPTPDDGGKLRFGLHQKNPGSQKFPVDERPLPKMRLTEAIGTVIDQALDDARRRSHFLWVWRSFWGAIHSRNENLSKLFLSGYCGIYHPRFGFLREFAERFRAEKNQVIRLGQQKEPSL